MPDLVPSSSGLADGVLRRIADELGGAVPTLPVPELVALEAASGGDPDRLKRWIKRRLAGEPLAYVLGKIEFRGHSFVVDARAYITDAETSLLVDAVIGATDAFTRQHGRPPLVAEFGTGGGSLALSLKLDRPALTVIGLDLDPAALRLAAENAAALRADVRFVESDLFDAWPLDAAPDFIFGDPPWGSEETLYAPERDAAHYRAMPAASAFPLGGRTGLHAQILRAVAKRGWPSHLILNGGVLPPAELLAVARDALWCEVAAVGPGISLLHCRMH